MNDATEKRTTCLVPGKMLPSKQAFMDLGFTFKVIPNSALCLATLPEGWTSVASNDFWVNLIDEKSRQRGSYIYELPGNNFMILDKRFDIFPKYDPDDSTKKLTYIFVRDQANKRILFSESCETEDSVEKNRLIKKSRAYLNAYYPEWEDPTKYWDLDSKDIKYWCQ